MSILEINELSFSYNDGQRKREILNHISYSFDKGNVYSILGASGSGKTTLLSLLANLEKIQSGNIFYNGKNILEIKPSEYRSKYISLVFQNFNLVSYLSGYQNIVLAMEISNVPVSKIKIYDILKELGISKKIAHQKVTKLSGGEQQRVCIARAIVNEPKVLICDEPTGNLDPKTSKEIVKVINSINKEMGATVIMVTHDKEIVNSMKKRVITLENGVLINDTMKGSYVADESN